MSEMEEEILNLRDEVAMLRAVLAGKQLTWTTEWPTVPGEYLYRYRYPRGKGRWLKGLMAINQGDPVREGLAECQWAGPIPEPTEPAAEGGGA